MTKQINRAFKPSVRYVNGLCIYFRDKYNVEVSKDGQAIVVTRWLCRNRNDYAKRWQPFVEKLYRTNGLRNLIDIECLAWKYGLDVLVARKPTPAAKGVFIRKTKHDWRKPNGSVQTN